MNHLKNILASLIGYFYNNIVTYIPSHIIRKYCLIMFGSKIGHHTRIDMCGYIGRVTKLNIGTIPILIEGAFYKHLVVLLLVIVSRLVTDATLSAVDMMLTLPHLKEIINLLLLVIMSGLEWEQQY